MGESTIAQGAPAPALSPESTIALAALRHEIVQHNQVDHNRSYLDKAIDFIWRSDERSLSNLERLQKQADDHIRNGQLDAVEKMREEVFEAVKKDQKALGLQNDISFYGSTGLKIGALFVSGPVGWIGTGALYALDQAKPKDSLGTQLIDGGLGLTKGLAFKGILSGVLGSNMNFAFKGGIMSLSGRGLDTMLTRENYYDAKTNSYSAWTGLKATGTELGNLEHLAIDGLVMGTAYLGGMGLSKLIGPALSTSPLWSRVSASSIAGVSRGAMVEISAARAAGEAISWSRVGTRALIMGGVYGLAAVPGGLQAEAQAAQDRQANTGDKGNGTHGDGQQGQVVEYRKIGTVKAVQLKEAAEWRTGNGDLMRGEAGDWKLTGPDGSTWTVKPDIFAQTYAPVAGSAGEFAKTAITKAVKLTAPMTIQTLEGTGTGQAGDYLVTGPKGEQYIVGGAKFESMYRPVKPE